MEFHDLQKIGLTKGEIKVYKALLKLGECTKTSLAKESGVSPSNIYDITNRLLEKGMISRVEKNGISNFSPANPKHILDYLEEKKKEIDKEKDYVDSILPLLLSKFNNSEEKVNVEVFNGWNGMKTVFDDLVSTLKKGDENMVFGASQGKNSKQADIFFSQYYKKVDEKGYKTKVIFNEEVRKNRERTDYFIKSKIHEIRFLNNDTFTELNFYKDTVLIIMLLENPLVIRIKNKEAADSFRKFFNVLWKQAKP